MCARQSKLLCPLVNTPRVGPLARPRRRGSRFMFMLILYIYCTKTPRELNYTQMRLGMYEERHNAWPTLTNK